MKLLLYLAYDGSAFCGYQAQTHGNTVQQTLNLATEEVFGHSCDVTGCSRTDSGVHARMFCATVTREGGAPLETTIPVDKIPAVLNIHLPDSIAVGYARWVPDDFHPRYSVTSKEYVYKIYNAPFRCPFEHKRSWHIPQRLDDEALERMNQAAAAFIGQRDFSACMASGSDILDKTRNVMSARVFREGDFVTFAVRADGFLYHMVRIMAGTLVDVALQKISADSIPERLASLDRRRMGRTAPAEGLYLNRVFYDDPACPGYRGGDILAD
ncbi:MAG: tRNA pseudouridine(38-40) synthase TruA [Clostridia bacterium]|nr:tRNA pseudouridine(38-40) synthase TruA [Clostridia bacterium]